MIVLIKLKWKLKLFVSQNRNWDMGMIDFFFSLLFSKEHRQREPKTTTAEIASSVRDCTLAKRTHRQTTKQEQVQSHIF